jgi:hypothetical protein
MPQDASSFAGVPLRQPGVGPSLQKNSEGLSGRLRAGRGDGVEQGS